MYSGADIKDWVILIAGNVFIVILIFRMISHYAKREWGELLTNFLIAIFIAWIVYSTDTFITFLKWLANKVSGGKSDTAGAVIDAVHGHALTLADGVTAAAPHVATLLSLAA